MEMDGWENLHKDVFTLVTAKLDGKSKANVSLTCKKWNEKLKKSERWRIAKIATYARLFLRQKIFTRFLSLYHVVVVSVVIYLCFAVLS